MTCFHREGVHQSSARYLWSRALMKRPGFVRSTFLQTHPPRRLQVTMKNFLPFQTAIAKLHICTPSVCKCEYIRLSPILSVSLCLSVYLFVCLSAHSSINQFIDLCRVRPSQLNRMSHECKFIFLQGMISSATSQRSLHQLPTHSPLQTRSRYVAPMLPTPPFPPCATLSLELAIRTAAWT